MFTNLIFVFLPLNMIVLFRFILRPTFSLSPSRSCSIFCNTCKWKFHRCLTLILRSVSSQLNCLRTVSNTHLIRFEDNELPCLTPLLISNNLLGESNNSCAVFRTYILSIILIYLCSICWSILLQSFSQSIKAR